MHLFGGACLFRRVVVNTKDFINVLAADSRLRWPYKRTIPLATLAGIVLTGGVFFVVIGPRVDIAQASETVRFMFKFVVTLTLAGTAYVLVFRGGRPGASLACWKWLLLAAPTLLGMAAIPELFATPSHTWMSRLIGSNSLACLTVIPSLSMIPLACLLLALRQGAPANPRLAGACAGLVASGIAATFYAANCIDDSPLFVATWYPIATAIVVLIGSATGSRLLRW
jgi:hypothetical protein